MTKEIEEKIEITQEVFHNIIKMMKSSEEDFFIALESWKQLRPTHRLNVILAKALRPHRREDLTRALDLPTSLNWEFVWDLFNVKSTTNLEKILFTELYNEYVELVMSLNSIAAVPRNIKVEVLWKI